MIVLGVDPGIRNTGIALVGPLPSYAKFCSTIKTKRGDWRDTYINVTGELEQLSFDGAVIESVGWYGPRKGMFELNRLVGAIWAYLISRTERTLVVMPNQKPSLAAKYTNRGCGEHEKDAICLASLGQKTWRVPTKSRTNTSKKT